jgi:hypothetical protein
MQSKKSAKKKVKPKKDAGLPQTSAQIKEGFEGVPDREGNLKLKDVKMPTPAEYRQTRSDELLGEAARQIKHLREINERLSIRTRAYDDFLSVFRNDPPSRNGSGATMGPDLVYSIERHLNQDSF